MKKVFAIFILLMPSLIFAQEELSLTQCYELVSTNYPLAKRSMLIETQKNLELEVIQTQKLPQLDFSAQATYQSDVIEVPIPNSNIEPLNKDQYRATVTVNQLIYAGGLIDATLASKTAELNTKQQEIEVSLYQLKKQVNQLYFNLLLQIEKEKLLTSKKELLQTQLSEVKSGIKNGLLLPTSDKVLEAELLKIEQQFKEIELSNGSLRQTLSSLIGKEVSSATILTQPPINIDLDGAQDRPELALFQLKKEQIEAAEELISKQNSPKLIGFANGGYGNPGLNMLDNSFQPFYTVGLKLNWNVFDWNANKKERESLTIGNDVVDNESEIFQLNTKIELEQQRAEIEKMEAFVASDREIIELRKEVVKSAESQLRNGVITSSAYVIEVTNLFESQITLSTHQLQLLLAKANFNITKGS